MDGNDLEYPFDEDTYVDFLDISQELSIEPLKEIDDMEYYNTPQSIEPTATLDPKSIDYACMRNAIEQEYPNYLDNLLHIKCEPNNFDKRNQTKSIPIKKEQVKRENCSKVQPIKQIRKKRKYKYKYKCEFCGRKYKYENSLSKHMKNDHGDNLDKQKFHCTQNNCNFSCNRKDTFKKHFLYHHSGIVIKCDSENCTYECATTHALKNHYIWKHDPEKFRCGIEGCTYIGNKIAVRQHKTRAHKNEDFKCKICKRFLSSMADLNKHKIRKHNTKKVK